MASAVAASALALPAWAHGSSRPDAGPVIAGSTVTLRGWRGTVPAGWRVVDLDRSPTSCVRWDQPVLYVGTPTDAQQCPAHLAGRTQAALVQPIESFTGPVDVTVRGTRAAGPWPAAALARQEVHVAEPDAGVAVVGAWRDRHATVDALLAGATATPGWTAPPASGPSSDGPGPMTAAAAPTITSTAFAGQGFDTCRAPSASGMAKWLASPFRGIGIYIGGMNRACSQPNLSAAWVAAVASQGWRLLPIYVGRQAPTNICSCTPVTAAATTEGRDAAGDAVDDAGGLTFPPGTTIFYDMEGYDTDVPGNSSTVVAFLAGWTARLHELGYRSGVYSSSASGVVDVVHAGPFAASTPDSIWSAKWNGVPTTDDRMIPSSWWQHQRIHQYSGDESIDYGGVTMSIARDAIDAPLAAAAGTAPPPTTIAVPGGPPTTQPASTTPPPSKLKVNPTLARRFVVRIYGLLVNRVPGQSEQDYWTWVIASGASRDHLVDLLLASSEWRRAVVTQAYTVGLQRAADDAGLAHWSQVLASGATPDLVVASLTASSERWADEDKDPATWVADVDHDVAGSSDATAEAHWTQLLDDGTSRLSVARQIAASTARSRAYVVHAYQAILGFMPASPTVTKWTTLYRRTFLPRQLLDAFAASPTAVSH